MRDPYDLNEDPSGFELFALALLALGATVVIAVCVSLATIVWGLWP